MLSKKRNFYSFIILILIILINKNIYAAPLCLEEDAIDNKEILNNKKLQEEDIESENNKTINLEDTNNKNEGEKEIEISADNKIEVDNEQGVMIVTGNAFVKEGLTSLQADMLTAFTCETKEGDTKILQINADNNVVIVSDQGKAFADKDKYLYADLSLEKNEPTMGRK